MPTSRLRVTPLEDRCTPASVAGNVITLDDAGEVLTISTGTPGEYVLTSTADINDAGPTATFIPTGPVSVVDSVGDTGVLFADSTALYGHDFSVTLDDGSLGVRFDGDSPFGTADLAVSTDRGIAVNPLATVSSTTGDIDFSANTQTAARVGEFIGVDVQGLVESTGTGGVTVRGRGGLLNQYGLYGVQVLGSQATNPPAPVVVGLRSAAGTLTVTGIGGGGTGDANIGVHVANGGGIVSRSLLQLTGTGGAGGGQGNYGVLVQAGGIVTTAGDGDVMVVGTAGGNGTAGYGVGVYLANGGSVVASGTGQAGVTGTGGGTGNSAHNSGVFVVGDQSGVASNGGNVTVSGTGGGGTGGGNAGVHVASGGTIRSGSGNTVPGVTTVNGTGGGGTGTHNFGVIVQGAGGLVSSSDGDTNVVGTGGAGSSSYGAGVFVFLGGKITAPGVPATNANVTGTGYGNAMSAGVVLLDSGAAVTSGGAVNLRGTANVSGGGIVNPTDILIAGRGLVSGGRVALTTNGLAIAGDGGTGLPNVAASVTAGPSGYVTITPRTAGGRIGVGTGVGDLFNPALLVTNDALGQITAGFLVIGSPGGGDIQIASNNRLTGVPVVQFLTGGGISFVRNSRTFAPNTSVLLSAGGDIIPPGNNSDVILFNSPLVTLDNRSKVRVPMNGIIPDQYGHLDATGAINLNGATLTLNGSYVPAAGDVFTLATGGSVTGTFNGLADGATLAFNGKTLRVNYTATTVTATAV